MIVCRYGGEELCILLAGKTLEQARTVAELLRAAICAVPIGNGAGRFELRRDRYDLRGREARRLNGTSRQGSLYSKRTGRSRVTGQRDVSVDFTATAEKH